MVVVVVVVTMMLGYKISPPTTLPVSCANFFFLSFFIIFRLLYLC